MTHRRHGKPSGFTLLELLVVVAVIALLVGLVAATMTKVRSVSRSFVCKSNLRTVAFEFRQFADDYAHTYRGDSEDLGRQGFFIEDFQQRLYRIDEFWDAPGHNQVALDPDGQPMMCPAAEDDLTRSCDPAHADCPVFPAGHVSIGMNMRLDRAPVQIGSFRVFRRVRLTRRILEHPSVPLAFDVDGAAADERDLLPFFSAPSSGANDLYANDRFWFPSLRHGKSLNAAFVGGHVLSTPVAEPQPGWDWKYQPPPN